MKNLRYLFLCLGAALSFTLISFPGSAQAADSSASSSLKIGVVNFKTCLEQSKIGQQEQGSFESMKKQMESVLEEKGKAIEALDGKANDPDYMDSLSPESETEFNRKLRGLKQEAMQLQNQYLQTLNQANMKIVQKLNSLIEKASKEVASEKQLDLIVNDEAVFFYAPILDVSLPVAKKMDEMAQKDNLFNKEKPAASLDK